MEYCGCLIINPNLIRNTNHFVPLDPRTSIQFHSIYHIYKHIYATNRFRPNTRCIIVWARAPNFHYRFTSINPPYVPLSLSPSHHITPPKFVSRQIFKRGWWKWMRLSYAFILTRNFAHYDIHLPPPIRVDPPPRLGLPVFRHPHLVIHDLWYIYKVCDDREREKDTEIDKGNESHRIQARGEKTH